MKIVILGLGDIGIYLVQNLINKGNEVIAVEQNKSIVDKISNQLDCTIVTGSGTSLETLGEAFTGHIDIFIACTDIDETNLIACLIVNSHFDVTFKIARVKNNAFITNSEIRTSTLEQIDLIISPDIEAAYDIARIIEKGGTSATVNLPETELEVRDIYVGQESYLLERNLIEIKRNLNEEFLIIGVFRDNQLIIPTGQTIIQQEDHVYAIANKKTFPLLYAKLGLQSRRIKDILIVGGGRVGSALIALLSARGGYNIKIIEMNKEVCKTLSHLYPNATVFHGDASNIDMLEQVNIESIDALVAATYNEELNILTAAYAKQVGVRSCITLVTKPNYMHVASKLGIDATISSKTSTGNAILQYIRTGENVKNAYSVFESGGEILEFTIGENSAVAGLKLMELTLPKDCLIIAVIKENQTLIPSGIYVIQPGDLVITFSTNNAVEDLKQYLTR